MNYFFLWNLNQITIYHKDFSDNNVERLTGIIIISRTTM